MLWRRHRCYGQTFRKQEDPLKNTLKTNVYDLLIHLGTKFITWDIFFWGGAGAGVNRFKLKLLVFTEAP